MTKRAESEEQTRQRITESAVELHGSLGPSGSSISAVAERAGVRRSTVYRHFPDEKALFAACANHWMAANPFPDLAQWAAVKNVDERLKTALEELYRFYGRTERMMFNVLRDEQSMPIVKESLKAYRWFVGDARDTLMKGRELNVSLRRRVRAAIGHALAFQPWRSLAIEQGLDAAESAEMMCLLVDGAGREK
jgi:AcrR family transcriptional regulator